VGLRACSNGYVIARGYQKHKCIEHRQEKTVILSDRIIKAAIEAGDIIIDPYDPEALGTNSYDVHLGDKLLTYADMLDENGSNCQLDARVDNPTYVWTIPPTGYWLYPGVLYLASTVEYTRTNKYVPFLDGKSSVGRLGIMIHCTAGRGDVGFAGHWTMEMHVVQAVKVYAGMPIGQLIYFQTGEVDVPYDKKRSAKYKDDRDPMPQPSRMWKNFK
jgi:dCTP deaminase